MSDPVPTRAQSDTSRTQARADWLARTLAELGAELQTEPELLTAEASSRRYYRLQVGSRPLVLMDAPPASEKNAEYVAVAEWLARQGLNPPRILAANLTDGFLLLEDLGDHLFADAWLNADDAARDQLDRRAIDTLICIQRASLADPPTGLPHYDEARLRRELGRFEQHFLDDLLGLAPPACWPDSCQILMQNNLEQPRAAVYLDYHSRNLLCLPAGDLGLVDFQDLLWGPVSYDLVSLLRDCYAYRPRSQVDAGVSYYLRQAQAADLPGTDDAVRFRRWFDLCGVQRHLKALGIFVHLYLAAGRSDYLADVPRVLTHVLDASRAHAELQPLADWLTSTVIPRLRTRLPEQLDREAP